MSDHSSLHLLIGGDKLSGDGRETQDVIDPATAEVLGALPHATADDLDRALNLADCPDAYEHRDAICALGERICTIAEDHPRAQERP